MARKTAVILALLTAGLLNGSSGWAEGDPSPIPASWICMRGTAKLISTEPAKVTSTFANQYARIKVQAFVDLGPFYGPTGYKRFSAKAWLGGEVSVGCRSELFPCRTLSSEMVIHPAYFRPPDIAPLNLSVFSVQAAAATL